MKYDEFSVNEEDLSGSEMDIIKKNADMYNRQVENIIRTSLDNLLGKGEWNEDNILGRVKILSQGTLINYLAVDDLIVAEWPTPLGLSHGYDQITIPTKKEKTSSIDEVGSTEVNTN